MSQEIHQRAAQKLIAFHQEAEQRNEWTFFVDEMYAPECVYICEYAGTMRVCANGIDEIKSTHYGRDMQRGWEGWTFPYLDVYVGNEGRVVTHWMNRGPGKRPDGSWFETPGHLVHHLQRRGQDHRRNSTCSTWPTRCACATSSRRTACSLRN